VLGHVRRRPAGTTASVVTPNARRGNCSGVTVACELLSPELLGVISSTCNVGFISRSLLHSDWQLSTSVKWVKLDCCIQVGTSTIQASAVVRDLGFHLDSELCMKQHVAKVAAACFCHLAACARSAVASEKRLPPGYVIALVITRLDYCNSLLAGLPLCTIEALQRWQRVQNAVARLIFELSPSEHITPCLLQLHWLPICWRVQFKLCCFMHAVVSRRCHTVAFRSTTVIFRLFCRPTVDKDQVRRTGLSRTPARLRGTHYRARIRETVDSASFRKLLKTHYFTSAFGISSDFYNCFISVLHLH